MLDSLSPKPGSRRPRHRVGRGVGSGWGKTSGRGQKGAGARAGNKKRAWMEGGQMPLSRRLPKFGFRSKFGTEYQVLNVRDLARFEAGAVVDPDALAQARLVAQARAPIKLLGNGEISLALTLRIDAASAGARRKVEAAGGRVELLPQPRRTTTVKA